MPKNLKLISWNVNGLRAVHNKGFMNFLHDYNPDILCLQEIKSLKEQLPEELQNLEGYTCIFNPAEKKGYSGTAIYTKLKPLSFDFGIKHYDHDNEGRVITAIYEEFVLVNVYTPNSKRMLERLGERQIWDKDFTKFLKDLQTEHKKPVICCGDLNVAHQEIDLARPSQNTKNAGFTQEERKGIQNHINNGFLDTFRYLHPNEPDKYTWWSYQAQSRERNVGWRIDYFLLSKENIDILKSADIHPEVHGSDHCPVSIQIQV